MKHGQEKSDLFVVAKKPANKPGRLGAELVEPREEDQGKHGRATHVPDSAPGERDPEAQLCTTELLAGFVVNHPRWEPGA
jgi:hypothetical protein